MRSALWASRALAANFVLVLVLDPEGPVYAATLTASIALLAAAATVAVLRDRVIEIDIVLRRAFVVAGVAAASLAVFVAMFAVVTALAGSSAGALGGGLAAALVAVRSGAEPCEPVIERALHHRGTCLGRLIIGARAPGESYGSADLALTELLASQVALVLDALRMATALQRSREAIVSAREEERRRLRRELHDGLGSALAGIALTLQAARNAGGPQGDELVEGARAQTQAAVADVRRMVRGLRPPMLENLGLAAALRAHADRLGPLQVDFELPQSPMTLPAAVELALTVIDDGHGLTSDAAAGVGLRSMRERAAELGGRVELAPGPSGGLAVEVRLPCATARSR